MSDGPRHRRFRWSGSPRPLLLLVVLGGLTGGCRGTREASPPGRPGGGDDAAAPVAVQPATGAPVPAAEPGDEGAAGGEGLAADLGLDPDEWRVARGAKTDFVLAWRPVDGGRVPRNREFAADLRLYRVDEPIAGAQVRVRGWMPEHGHGFVRRPVVEELGGGAYRAEGVLLHMRGSWQVLFDVIVEGVGDTVTFELRLR